MYIVAKKQIMSVYCCILAYALDHLYLLCGDDLSRSYIDLYNSTSVLCLNSLTLSLLLSVLLIYSSVCTKVSSSLFKSLFWLSRTLMCYCKAAISALKSPFLSRIDELLNLTSSNSFLMTIIWSSLLLFLLSKSNNKALNSLFLWSS